MDSLTPVQRDVQKRHKVLRLLRDNPGSYILIYERPWWSHSCIKDTYRRTVMWFRNNVLDGLFREGWVEIHKCCIDWPPKSKECRLAVLTDAGRAEMEED